MAKVAKNLVLHGARGSVGDQLVIRQRKGQTVLAAMPTVDEDRQPTESQKAQRGRFQEAVFYGKAQMAIPEAKAEYEAKAKGTPRTAFNVVVADFPSTSSGQASMRRTLMKPRDLSYLSKGNRDEVDLTGYHGAVGDTVRVRATDDFKVAQVQVSIVNADGSMVEEGNAIERGAATESPANSGRPACPTQAGLLQAGGYTPLTGTFRKATAAVPTGITIRIGVTAMNRGGNGDGWIEKA